MKNPSISHAHKSSYTHTHILSHTRGRQKGVYDQPLGYSILPMEVAAPVDQVDPMALPVHVPAPSAPVAGAWFKRNALKSAPRSPILEDSHRRRVGPRYKGFLLALDARASLAYGWRAVGNPAI